MLDPARVLERTKYERVPISEVTSALRQALTDRMGLEEYVRLVELQNAVLRRKYLQAKRAARRQRNPRQG